jgi:uncharacterized membrane protein
MVVTDINETNRTGTIILRPNHSWSWQANVLFLSFLMAVSMIIAFGFLFVGAWVILPFSILEMTVVALCIHHCVKQCKRQEVITISDYEVKVERGIKGPSQIQTFIRTWATWRVHKPRHPWDPVSLAIRSHGQELEIGSFLNRRDKTYLVSQLKKVTPA